MSQAPIVVDTLLAGEISVVISANESTVTASIPGYRPITADQLRKLADQMDRLGAAAHLYFDVQEDNNLRDFVVGYSVRNPADRSELIEESTTIQAANGKEAVDKFEKVMGINRSRVTSVFDADIKDYVNY